MVRIGNKALSQTALRRPDEGTTEKGTTHMDSRAANSQRAPAGSITVNRLLSQSPTSDHSSLGTRSPFAESSIETRADNEI